MHCAERVVIKQSSSGSRISETVLHEGLVKPNTFGDIGDGCDQGRIAVYLVDIISLPVLYMCMYIMYINVLA